MLYAIIPHKCVESKSKNSDYHIFEAYLNNNDNTISINMHSMCSLHIKIKPQYKTLVNNNLDKKIISLNIELKDGKEKNIKFQYYKNNNGIFMTQDKEDAMVFIALLKKHLCDICVKVLFEG